MPAEAPALATLVFPFMPADETRRGTSIEAGADWAFPHRAAGGGFDVIVWGRLPDSAASLTDALRAAGRRELALRTLGREIPDPLRIRAIHRIGPRQLGSGLRGRLRAAIRSGAIVELSAGPGQRVLDAVADAAHVRLETTRLYFGSGGALLARVGIGGGGSGLLRVAQAGSTGDPERLADMLRRLGAAGVTLAPRLVGSGSTGGASWTVETALAGRRPTGLTPDLARQAAEALAGFPRVAGPMRALEHDLRGIATGLPSRGSRVSRLADDIAPVASSLPAILRHGDLWTGNLLVDGARLSGMIDWDAAHEAGLPGSDLLQLVATDLRRRSRRSLGAAYLSRPWQSATFQAAATAYWSAVGVAPSSELIEMAGLSWWAVEIHGTITRLPHRAVDERWLSANVDPVLSALGY
jgi:aminoglycoside phosphotransferase